MAIICINPGHGAGGDYGACANGRREADDVLRIALQVKLLLEASGVKVVITRTTTDGKGPVIAECVRMANNARADYYLSLHENAASADATGAEAWVSTEAPAQTAAYAQQLLDAYVGASGLKSRGVKRGAPAGKGYRNYAVCQDTTMPAVLLEMGFVTNSGDMAANDAHLPQIAQALAQALCKIVGATYRGEAAQPAPTPPTPAKPDTGYAEPSGLIQYGSAGDGVKWVQQQLKRHGYNVGTTGVDGKCGNATVTAIKAFQRAHGLAADGIVGTKTKAALKGQTTNACPYAAPSGLIQSGSTGDGAKWVQWQLKRHGYNIGTTGIDGKCGNATVAAIKAFQRAHGLAADGIVGANTKAALAA